MIITSPPIETAMTGDADQPVLWLPPERLRRYQVVKAAGGALAAFIFLGWLAIQWSNPIMRLLAIGLIVITGWVTVVSVVIDRRRSRGRQIAVSPGRMCITTPYGGEQTIALSDIHRARWRDDERENAGLWLYDCHDRELARLDTDFLAEEAEARAFVGWLRQHGRANFPVAWPDRV